jgi:hypothetical protein
MRDYNAMLDGRVKPGHDNGTGLEQIEVVIAVD